MKKIAILAGILHILLLVVTYLVLPYVVPEEMLDDIKHWVLVSFSSIFLLLVMIDESRLLNVFIIFLIGGLTLLLIAWVIPKYVKEKQDRVLATHILIVSSSIFITMVGAIFTNDKDIPLSQQPTFTSTAPVAGGRRRR
jgi:hypothetical protein